MYHSKSSGAGITLPRNYRGNAFNKNEEKSSPLKLDAQDKSPDYDETFLSSELSEAPMANSLLAGISTEDLLLLGLILVIKDSNPNDPVLLLLLILLLAK